MSPETNSVFTNLLTVLKSRNSSVLEAGIKFTIGKIIEVQVLSKEGDLFLLQHGEKRFFAQAKTTLEPGQRIALEVIGSKDEIIVLKRVENSQKETMNNSDDLDRRIMKKYGVNTEKDMVQVENVLKKIPCEPAAAIRYLLDPHLVTALLLLNYPREKDFYKIEVNQYKSTQNKQDVFEIALDLELAKLGHMEIIVRFIEGIVYTRIWVESVDAEQLLKGRKSELLEICPNLELVPLNQGPLIIRDIQKKVDIKV